MKKTIQLLAVMFLFIFLTACNIQTVEQYEKMEEQEQSVKHPRTVENLDPPATKPVITDIEQAKEDTIQQEEKKKETEIENKEPKEIVKESKEPKEPKESATVETKQHQATVPETKKTTTEKSKQAPTKQDQKKNEQPTKQTNPVIEQPKQSNEQSPKKHSVTIAIRVDTLLKNWDLLDPSLQSEKYVPKNGVILKTTTYELLSDKETVWDVLQRATKEHKIQMEYQGANENIYNSVYVEGINHLYEFSAGPLSGWMYKVNGVYPNYGCSQYTLKDGDVIEWQYTVDLGRDLGHEWTGE